MRQRAGQVLGAARRHVRRTSRRSAVDQLKAKAAELGLNAEQFNACLDSGKYAAQVQADMKEGSAAGVSGTPAMFINGRFLSGACRSSRSPR